MRVRWTTDAADDLERICDFIAESRPKSARKVAKTIVDGVGILELFPNRGRAGRVESTREFVFASLPFVAIYEVHGDAVQVLPSCTARNGGHNRWNRRGPNDQTIANKLLIEEDCGGLAWRTQPGRRVTR